MLQRELFVPEKADFGSSSIVLLAIAGGGYLKHNQRSGPLPQNWGTGLSSNIKRQLRINIHRQNTLTCMYAYMYVCVCVCVCTHFVWVILKTCSIQVHL